MLILCHLGTWAVTFYLTKLNLPAGNLARRKPTCVSRFAVTGPPLPGYNRSMRPWSKPGPGRILGGNTDRTHESNRCQTRHFFPRTRLRAYGKNDRNARFFGL